MFEIFNGWEDVKSVSRIAQNNKKWWASSLNENLIKARKNKFLQSKVRLIKRFSETYLFCQENAQKWVSIFFIRPSYHPS